MADFVVINVVHFDTSEGCQIVFELLLSLDWLFLDDESKRREGKFRGATVADISKSVLQVMCERGREKKFTFNSFENVLVHSFVLFYGLVFILGLHINHL